MIYKSDTIKKITGEFRLSGTEAKLRPLKAAFGSDYVVKKKEGTFVVDEGFKSLSILLNMLIANYELLQKNKIDTITISLKILYQNQCNWEASKEEVRKMDFLKAGLQIIVDRTY